MTESFVFNASPYAPNLPAAVAQPGAVKDPTPVSTEEGPAPSPDWQPDETALLPGFGVERARELIMWLINLEIRLPPYSEASPA